MKPAKKLKTINEDIQLNPSLLSEHNMNNLKEHWKSVQQLSINLNDSNSKLRLEVNPFRICVIEDFLNNPEITEELLTELENIKFNFEKKDLFQFSYESSFRIPTNDKFKVTHSVLNFLKSNVLNWIRDITNLDLVSTSISTSLYQQGDYLLPHDDHSDNRGIAFVYYLVPNHIKSWSSDYGGELSLYSINKDYSPIDIIQSISPKNNQFVFFKVGFETYHRVNELLDSSLKRYTINGWFNFKNAIKLKDNHLSYTDLYDKIPRDIVPLRRANLAYWINKIYLNPATQKSIQKTFETRSEISLIEFFYRKVFHKITYYLKKSSNEWKVAGPLSMRYYRILNTDKLGNNHYLNKFVRLFYSSKMLHFLSSLTELDFLKSNNIKNKLHFEFQYWNAGDYSLLSERKWFDQNALDIIMFFGYSNNNNEIGRPIYIELDDLECIPILEVLPRPYSLNLVYREKNIGRLVSYLQRTKNPNPFYVLVLTYYEE